MSVHAEAEGGGRGRGSMLTPRRACAITGGLCGALDSLSRATLLSGAEDERDAWRRGTWRRVRVALRVFETKKMEGSKAAHRQTAYPFGVFVLEKRHRILRIFFWEFKLIYGRGRGGLH